MPALPPPGRSARRLAVFALLVCVLAVAAAVVSFARGSLLGIVWVLMAGVSSNMAWYYVRRARAGARSRTRSAGPSTCTAAGASVGPSACTAAGTSAATSTPTGTTTATD